MQKINLKNAPNKSGGYPAPFWRKSLCDKILSAPKRCGVYFFRDKRGVKTFRGSEKFARPASQKETGLGRILYIGKAVNLKSRLASYFKPQLGGRTAKLMEKTARVSWQETDSEIEAIILESQLIKKHRPPFNIMLRDDKQYFYVRFTNEKFPKIFLTHQPKADSRKLTAAIAGPFTDGFALKTVLKLLRRIFPYCTCKEKRNNYCLNYHIGKCLGFCCLKNAESRIKNYELRRKEYKKNIKAIREILSGRKSSLVKKLKKEMETLAHKSKFEKAIDLRNKIEKLEKIFKNAQIIHTSKFLLHNSKTGSGWPIVLRELASVLNSRTVPRRIEGYDVSNIQGQFATGAMVVFINGQPDKNQYRKFKIKVAGSSNDIAMLKEMLTRRFNHPEWPYPDLIIVDGGKAQLGVAVKTIYAHRKTRGLAMTRRLIPIIALTKDKRHRGSHIYLWSSQDHRLKEVAMPLKKLPEEVRNLILQVDAEAHRFAINYYRKLHRKNH